jgi:hypothetical protein
MHRYHLLKLLLTLFLLNILLDVYLAFSWYGAGSWKAQGISVRNKTIK